MLSSGSFATVCLQTIAKGVLDPRDPGQCTAFEKHREFMVGTRVSFSSFYPKATKAFEPIVTYVIKLPIPMYSKKSLVSFYEDG